MRSPTVEEIAAKKDRDEQFMRWVNLDLSSCCKADLDGRYKGHGPRLCSKCGKVEFIV